MITEPSDLEDLTVLGQAAKPTLASAVQYPGGLPAVGGENAVFPAFPADEVAAVLIPFSNQLL
jgi:hypothetical protein